MLGMRIHPSFDYGLDLGQRPLASCSYHMSYKPDPRGKTLQAPCLTGRHGIPDPRSCHQKMAK